MVSTWQGSKEEIGIALHYESRIIKLMAQDYCLYTQQRTFLIKSYQRLNRGEDFIEHCSDSKSCSEVFIDTIHTAIYNQASFIKMFLGQPNSLHLYSSLSSNHTKI